MKIKLDLRAAQIRIQQNQKVYAQMNDPDKLPKIVTHASLDSIVDANGESIDICHVDYLYSNDLHI